MNMPRIELIPGRPAVCSDATVVLDVLVRVTPPLPDVHFPRPALNLALVLDRSGSMAGSKKMPYARDAAAFAVRQLMPTDRVSVTVFDEVVSTIVPGGLAVDKAAIIRQIDQIQPRGSTDLHGGWVEGGRQAESGRVDGAINRVLLLSDGQANVGVTDPNTLATEARGLAGRGVGTTTLGVGDDYNEDLMEAMATAGDGNYYYIESPAQLVDLFQTELQGLMATLGQKVSLGLEPQGGAAVSDVLNDFEKAPTGRWMLPNLIVGMPVQVVVRLSVPVRPGMLDLLTVRLAWDDPRSGERRVLHASLGATPAVPMTEWSNLPVDPDVREQEALLMIARAQKEASRAHERGDLAGTVGWVGSARGYVAELAPSPAILEELQAIDQMDEALGTDDAQHFRKLSKYRSYLRQASRPSPPLSTPPEPPEPPAGS
jgi:Ca-activated chloride channel homolog